LLKIGRFAALVVLLAVANAGTALAVPHEGDPTTPFTLVRTSGGTLTLAQLHGKPAYFNFFASWCGPCNVEAPAVADLYTKYHKRGLAVIGVDELEDKAKAIGFASKYRWTFPVVLDDGKMGRNYGVIALPVHVFIDKRGKVSTYRLGEMTPNEIEDAIHKIL